MKNEARFMMGAIILGGGVLHLANAGWAMVAIGAAMMLLAVVRELSPYMHAADDEPDYDEDSEE